MTIAVFSASRSSILRRSLSNRHSHYLTRRAHQLMSRSENVYGNFDLVQQFKLNYATDVSVSKWRSRETGLRVVHLDYDAPIVNGYFVVATEIFDDTGRPHTLEHLVFMGSEKYPYKGIIDHFANRGGSNGTNAWTDTDHTAYTVSTAGAQGFLQLLPIYVDHILFPTMSKAGYLTEVHHINGKGHDSGVVYSEMQGRENTSGDLMALSLQRLQDPPGNAYRSETGGLMEALRNLTVDQIRTYHAQYYVPHNLCLIVCGKLSSGTKSLLDVVQNHIEPDLIKHGYQNGPRPPGWKRPFLETPSAVRKPPTESIETTVEFPEKDESVGELILGFLGPPPNDFLSRKALDILGTYMTSTAVAPLNKEFIEIDSPLCTYIYFAEDARAGFVNIPLYIGSVPTEHLDTFHEKLSNSLKRVAREGFDMERMSRVIARDERQLKSKLESSKGDTFSGSVITDFLYGDENGSDMKGSMDELTLYEELKGWKNDDWVSLLQRYYIDPPPVVVKGKPSHSLVLKLEDAESKRIQAQVKRLGEDGLARSEKELEEAKKEHELPIPSEILTSFPLPDVKSISWIPVSSVQEAGEGRSKRAPEGPGARELLHHIESDGSPLNFFAQYDHVKSDFVTVHAFFSLKDLPNRLRPYVSTYLSTFFSLPVKLSSGQRLSHEEVINRLDEESVSYDVSLGLNGAFAELIRVSIKVERAMYAKAVAWIRDLVYGAEFDIERVMITIAKMQQSLPELKRDGSTVMASVWSNMIYDESSTSRAGGILPQMEVIPLLADSIQNTPEKVIADLEEIRKCVTNPSGVRLSVTGNILEVDKPRSVLKSHFDEVLPSCSLSPVPTSIDTLSPIGKNPVQEAVVMSLPTIESSYTIHTTSCINGFDHPDYPSLRLAMETLNATESYLWRYIRGSGLAYGANMSLDLESGLLSFNLYRSSDSTQALKEAAKVVKGLVDGSILLDSTTLDAAKSTLVYGATRNVSSESRAAIVSFGNQALKNVSGTHQIGLLDKYQTITCEEVLRALSKYFLPLFESSSSVAVVVTAPSRAAKIQEDLTDLGFRVRRQELEIDDEESASLSGDSSRSASN